MSELAAFAGFLATTSLIVVAIVAYASHQQAKEIERLREMVRGIGLRVGSPESELPPPRPVVDEYARDAIIDDDSVNREWQVPRSWQHWDA